MYYLVEKRNARSDLVAIPLERWLAFVDSCPELRLVESDHSVVNPFIRTPMKVVNLGGDAELRDREDGSFGWMFTRTPKGRIGFQSLTGGHGEHDTAWRVATRFAQEFGAQIVENDGSDEDDIPPTREG